MTGQGYKDLQVWQKAMDLVIKAYQISRLLPENEKFGLVTQIQRSAVSIPANIAEGHGRHYEMDFIHFLRIANGSLLELETHLELLICLDYLSKDQLFPTQALVTEVGRMLIGLIHSIKEHHDPKG